MNVLRPEDKNKDFTLAHYSEILNAIKNTHKVFSFKDVHQLGSKLWDFDRFVIMRHDVEFSLASALQIAKLDYEAGIHSTFFLLHTSDYNIFEEESALVVRQILDLGHDIGLHYDAALFESMGVEPIEIASNQIALMEKFWNTKVYAMSSHMPMRSGKTFSVPGVIDVYDKQYLSDIKYITDSTQTWREDVISSLLDKYPKIHLLLHEYYWSNEGYNWDTLLLLEAHRKFNELTNRAVRNIRKYQQGLLMRSEKDKEFKKRYLS